MADKQREKQKRLQRRKFGIRKTLFGSPEKPRLSVFRSDKHIYAQLIDDFAGKTLAAVATTSTETRGELKNGGNIAAAKLAGTILDDAHATPLGAVLGTQMLQINHAVDDALDVQVVVRGGHVVKEDHRALAAREILLQRQNLPAIA